MVLGIDIKGMARSAAQIMFDQGQIGTEIGVVTDDAFTEDDFAYGGMTKCSVHDKPEPEETQDGAKAPIVDAIVRFPRGTEIDEQSRFKWLLRHGVALGIPQIYRVVGTPRISVSAVTARLKLIPGQGNSSN